MILLQVLMNIFKEIYVKVIIFLFFIYLKNYIIKSDCEGGERFLLNDYKDIIGKCKHFCMEIHFPNPRHKQFDKFPSYMEYYNWVQTFSHTHKITYHHSRKKSGIGVYVLSRYI